MKGLGDVEDVFPARAGMSRPPERPGGWLEGFPRTRGDEPYQADTDEYSGTFSPHARG